MVSKSASGQGTRSNLILYVAAAYLGIVAVFISTYLPFETSLQAGVDSEASLSSIQRSFEAIPYVARVKAAMSHSGYDQATVTDKVRFLSMSYFVMLVAYAVLVVAVVTLFCFGRRSENRRELAWSATALLGIAIFVAIDVGFFFLSVHGFGDLPVEDPMAPVDYIISNNGFIMINLTLMTFSLLTSLVIARFITLITWRPSS